VDLNYIKFIKSRPRALDALGFASTLRSRTRQSPAPHFSSMGFYKRFDYRAVFFRHWSTWSTLHSSMITYAIYNLLSFFIFLSFAFTLFFCILLSYIIILSEPNLLYFLTLYSLFSSFVTEAFPLTPLSIYDPFYSIVIYVVQQFQDPTLFGPLPHILLSLVAAVQQPAHFERELEFVTFINNAMWYR